MYSSIPQILVLFRVLSRQSLRAQKRKKKIEKEVLQVLPGHVVVFVLVFVSVRMCFAEHKVNV